MVNSMYNIWKIFTTDIRRISNNVVAVVIIMGLSILPALSPNRKQIVRDNLIRQAASPRPLSNGSTPGMRPRNCRSPSVLFPPSPQKPVPH